MKTLARIFFCLVLLTSALGGAFAGDAAPPNALLGDREKEDVEAGVQKIIGCVAWKTRDDGKSACTSQQWLTDAAISWSAETDRVSTFEMLAYLGYRDGPAEYPGGPEMTKPDGTRSVEAREKSINVVASLFPQWNGVQDWMQAALDGATHPLFRTFWTDGQYVIIVQNAEFEFYADKTGKIADNASNEGVYAAIAIIDRNLFDKAEMGEKAQKLSDYVWYPDDLAATYLFDVHPPEPLPKSYRFYPACGSAYRDCPR